MSRHHYCMNSEFKIRTNPKERTFDYVVGIRKKQEEFNSAEAGTLGVIDTDFGPGIFEYKDGKITDAPSNELNLLEKNACSHRKTLTEHDQMISLLQLNKKLETDADANAALRTTFRKDRKAKKRRLNDAADAGLGRGIEMLSGDTDADVLRAKRAMRKTYDEQAHRSERDKFKGIRASCIFDSKMPQGTKRRIEVKAHHGANRTERCETKQIEFKPHRLRKKETSSVAAVKAPVASNSYIPSAESSALAALAAYGSDSD